MAYLWEKRKKRSPKKQRPYQAQLLKLSADGKSSTVLDSRDFKAVDTTGAKRASAHWYKSLSTDDPVAGAHTAWVIIPSSDGNPEFHCCKTSRGLLAFHATDGKDIAEVEVEEAVADANPDDVMRRLIANPEQVKREYRGRSAVLMGIMEDYFDLHNPTAVWSRRDNNDMFAADFVYDWPGVPQMLARAWRVEQKHIRRVLGKKAVAECPNCGKQISFITLRAQGGFEATMAGDPCPDCKTPLIEINANVLKGEGDEWRHPNSPHWIPINPEQETEYARKRLALAGANPYRNLCAGVYNAAGRDAYRAFIEQSIRQLSASRVVQVSVPEMEGRLPADKKMRAFFKTWTDALGGGEFNVVNQRERFLFDKLHDVEWIMFDHMERGGLELYRRLLHSDWRHFRMVWLWQADYSEYCYCLDRRRRRRYGETPERTWLEFSDTQALWLPDASQLFIQDQLTKPGQLSESEEEDEDEAHTDETPAEHVTNSLERRDPGQWASVLPGSDREDQR